jgi:hypothetical protein
MYVWMYLKKREIVEIYRWMEMNEEREINEMSVLAAWISFSFHSNYYYLCFVILIRDSDTWFAMRGEQCSLREIEEEGNPTEQARNIPAAREGDKIPKWKSCIRIRPSPEKTECLLLFSSRGRTINQLIRINRHIPPSLQHLWRYPTYWILYSSHLPASTIIKFLKFSINLNWERKKEDSRHLLGLACDLL